MFSDIALRPSSASFLADSKAGATGDERYGIAAATAATRRFPLVKSPFQHPDHPRGLRENVRDLQGLLRRGFRCGGRWLTQAGHRQRPSRIFITAHNIPATGELVFNS